MSHKGHIERLLDLPDDEFLAAVDADIRSVEEVRADLACADIAALCELATDEDYTCDECTEINCAGFCNCMEELRYFLLGQDDEVLSEFFDLTSIEQTRADYEVFRCLDCADFTDTEYYMVHDHLWQKAVPNEQGMLCLGCLEKRLGCKLSPEDFSDAPLNKQYFIGHDCASPRLLNRLGFQ